MSGVGLMTALIGCNTTEWMQVASSLDLFIHDKITGSISLPDENCGIGHFLVDVATLITQIDQPTVVSMIVNGTFNADILSYPWIDTGPWPFAKIMWELYQTLNGDTRPWQAYMVEGTKNVGTEPCAMACYELAIALNSPLREGRRAAHNSILKLKESFEHREQVLARTLATEWPLWGILADYRHIPKALPANKRVEAIVTFGRKYSVKILDRYLRLNLVRAGGLLSKVHFVRLGAEKEDMEFLAKIMNQVPEYDMPEAKGNYLAKMYTIATDPDVIYVKLDDDIVYISPEAFEVIVYEKLTSSSWSFVSANVINHAILGSLHQEMGALRNEYRPVIDGWFANIEKKAQSDCLWRKAECGEWVHRSFLHHINRGTEDVFKFTIYDFHQDGYGGYKDDNSAWITPTKTSRWSINFFAFTTADLENIDWKILDEDDESAISYMQPHNLQRPACAMGHALVAHFSYSWQEEKMLETSILGEYDRLSLDAIERRWDRDAIYPGGVDSII